MFSLLVEIWISLHKGMAWHCPDLSGQRNLREYFQQGAKPCQRLVRELALSLSASVRPEVLQTICDQGFLFFHGQTPEERGNQMTWDGLRLWLLTELETSVLLDKYSYRMQSEREKERGEREQCQLCVSEWTLGACEDLGLGSHEHTTRLAVVCSHVVIPQSRKALNIQRKNCLLLNCSWTWRPSGLCRGQNHITNLGCWQTLSCSVVSIRTAVASLFKFSPISSLRSVILSKSIIHVSGDTCRLHLGACIWGHILCPNISAKVQ